MSITVTSEAFAGGEAIPKKYTGEGEDVSPPLSWTGAPKGAKQFALVCDDPDAPTADPWVHWVFYGIPSGVDSLAEGVDGSARPAGAVDGVNSFGSVGYRGPMPPRGHGAHHYHFKLYALDTELALKPRLGKNTLIKTIKPHILAEGELVGTYERK